MGEEVLSLAVKSLQTVANNPITSEYASRMNMTASLRDKNLTYKNSTSANNKQRGPSTPFWLNSPFQ
jgi:hypothetical protein